MNHLYEARILLVDDHPDILKMLSSILTRRGFLSIRTASDCQTARKMFRLYEPELVVLDIMLPDGDGFSLMRDLRASSDVPVLFLSAKDQDNDRLLGLGLGADDYITKPFNLLELKARIRALLRRSGVAAQNAKTGVLTAGHITLDPGERSARRDGAPVELTAKEFDLMELLLRNPGRVYSRENLLNVVWGYEYIGDYRTVDVHVRRLREKLELDPASPQYIRTKWGVGYYLANPEQQN